MNLEISISLPPFCLLEAVNVYRSFGLAFAKWAQSHKEKLKAERVVLVFDRVLTSKERSNFRSSTKGLFAGFDGVYFVYFHNVNKDFNGQVADYVAWAHYVQLERNENRPLNSLPPQFSAAENLLDWLEKHQ